MGECFLYGQSGGGGSKFATGTFTTAGSWDNTYTVTIQLDTSFVPDYIIMCPVASTALNNYCRDITAVSYVKSADAWTVAFNKSSSSSNTIYNEADFAKYYGTISYDETAGTVTFSSTDYNMFYINTTWRWVMWKE